MTSIHMLLKRSHAVCFRRRPSSGVANPRGGDFPYVSEEGHNILEVRFYEGLKLYGENEQVCVLYVTDRSGSAAFKTPVVSVYRLNMLCSPFVDVLLSRPY